MKQRERRRWLTALLGTGCLTVGSGAAAAPLALSDVPLAVSTAAAPNVMLMLDNSGSMQNIVPDSPYDPDTTYLANCPTTNSNRVATGTQVELRIASGSPHIRIGSSNHLWGTGSSRRCFVSDSEYWAKLQADGSGGGSTTSYLPAPYTGNYLNWYFSTTTDPGGCSNTWASGRKPCSESRMMIAKTAGKALIDTMGSGMRVGLSAYNGRNGGQLLEGVGNLDAAKRTALKAQLDALAATGMTPLAETLSDIGWYFSRGATNLTLHPDGAAPTTISRSTVFGTSGTYSYTRHSSWSGGVNPIHLSCQKSFAVLMTDGRPQGDRAISTSLRDYAGDCAAGLCDAAPRSTALPSDPLPNANYGSGTRAGRSYEGYGSDYLDDVAMALNEMDLRPDLDDPPGMKNNLATYIISFADEQAINDPLMQDTVARGGGEFFVAGNEQELATAFQAALAAILERSGSSASAAANTGFVGAGSKFYQARFNSTDWSGQLLAFAVDDDLASASYGQVLKSGPGPDGSLWDAGSKLPGWNSRNIVTLNGLGVPFRWDQLNASQQASLLDSAPMLDYLRGNDNPGTGTWRPRASKLGDIVHSAPVYVGAPAFRYPDTLESAPYSTFKTNNQNRAEMVYVGANDGMLHGLDAESGVELMAYVPSHLFDKLPALASPGYAHQYYVDGSPTVIDAFIGNQWRTVLIGGLNKGGQGIYALDVTNPASFSESPTDAESLVLWEFDDASDADLGYTFSQPAIVKLQNGTWAAIFGNGYNNTEPDGNASATGNAVLYIVNLATGALIKKIDTGVGATQDPTGQDRPNGLATVAAADIDGDHKVDTAYAGDLFGNLWKFDLSDSNANQWDVAFKSGNTRLPLFTACAANTCTAANRQPITSRPSVGRHPGGTGVMVYFGTGKHLESADNNGAAGGKQSFYAIWDKDVIVGGRSALLQQSITNELYGQAFGSSNFDVRVTSDHAIEWGTHMGWHLDLVSPVLGEQGERQVTNSILRNGKIIFTTTIPNDDPCLPGGQSWLMEMDAGTGSRLQYSPFDLNNDRLFNESDYVTVTIDGEQVEVPVSGIRTTGGGASTPTIVASEDGETKCISTSAGMECILENPGPIDTGRQSWRELGREP